MDTDRCSRVSRTLVLDSWVICWSTICAALCQRSPSYSLLLLEKFEAFPTSYRSAHSVIFVPLILNFNNRIATDLSTLRTIVSSLPSEGWLQLLLISFQRSDYLRFYHLSIRKTIKLKTWSKKKIECCNWIKCFIHSWCKFYL